jgi:tetraacyldisaccharide 4'-kinase
MRRPWLLPLVPVYGAVLGVKRRLFVGEPRRLVRPVISVGSLSAGGAGKTPVVVALAELLGRNGFTVDVLSRGYGRESRAVERVDPAGSAARFGDEPLEMARRTGAAVYVGSDRYAAGLLAEKTAGGSALLHLLDDGFQHRRLARALDVLLLTQEDAADRLLPAGNLREPLGRLREAGAVVVREDEADGLREALATFARVDVPVWVIRRRLEVPAEIAARPLAFCGIARPESFFSMLRAEGVELAETVAFGDHHGYGWRDLTRLVAAAERSGADGFVTTEKDAVKLSKAMRARLGSVGQVTVVRLAVGFADEAAVVAQVLAAAG